MRDRTLFLPIAVPDVPDLPPLAGLDEAVRRLRGYVATSWPQPCLDVMGPPSGGRWTRQAVRESLGAQLLSAHPDDLVVVYWTGHGRGGDGAHKLILTDDELNTADLAEWLLKSPSDQVLLLLDCCYAGVGANEMQQRAVEVWRQRARSEDEDRSVTVLSVARNEQALEGAFVSAMMAVIEDGPPTGTRPTHRWDRSREFISVDELAAAVNAHLGQTSEQRAYTVELRRRTGGQLLPSLWHVPDEHVPSVDAYSDARRDAQRRLLDAGAPLDSWTADALRAHRGVVRSLTVDENLKLQLLQLLDALDLALSADTLVDSLVRRSSLTVDALAQARTAAVGRWLRGPQLRQFDLLFDAARRRARQPATQGPLAMIRFVARLAHECGAREDWPDRLIDWAENLGVEPPVVNALVHEAVAAAPSDRRLVIDITGQFEPTDRTARTAIGWLYEGGQLVSGRLTTEIASESTEDILAAIGTLAAEALPQPDHIDVIVPERLVLLDPSMAPITIKRRRSTKAPSSLGRHFEVAVRYVDRATDWERRSRALASLTATGCGPVREVEAGLDDPDTLLDELAAEPSVVAFKAYPEENGEPSSILLDVLAESPIVLWPARMTGRRDDIGEIVRARWTELPEAVLRAQRLVQDEDLTGIRLVWDDGSWLPIAEAIVKAAG